MELAGVSVVRSVRVCCFRFVRGACDEGCVSFQFVRGSATRHRDHYIPGVASLVASTQNAGVCVMTLRLAGQVFLEN